MAPVLRPPSPLPLLLPPSPPLASAAAGSAAAPPLRDEGATGARAVGVSLMPGLPSRYTLTRSVVLTITAGTGSTSLFLAALNVFQ